MEQSALTHFAVTVHMEVPSDTYAGQAESDKECSWLEMVIHTSLLVAVGGLPE